MQTRKTVPMLSQKAKYALRALLVLAEEGDDKPLLIADIAERHSLPKKFLEQILLDLKHHGLVQSRRGRGGYSLLKPASEISFGQVVRIIDGRWRHYLPQQDGLSPVRRLSWRGELRHPPRVRPHPSGDHHGARPHDTRRCLARSASGGRFHTAAGGLSH